MRIRLLGIDKTRGLSRRFVRVLKAEEKKGTQGRKGAKVQREGGKRGRQRRRGERKGAKAQGRKGKILERLADRIRWIGYDSAPQKRFLLRSFFYRDARSSHEQKSPMGDWVC